MSTHYIYKKQFSLNKKQISLLSVLVSVLSTSVVYHPWCTRISCYKNILYRV